MVRMEADTEAQGGLVALLEEQQDDYRALYAAGLAHRGSLAREDLQGVSASLARTNALMGRIQLRQARLPADLVTRTEPEVAQRTRAIREAILRVEKLRRANEGTVRRLLEETRGEIRRSTQGRKVARGYRRHRVEDARFFDGRK